MPPPSNILLHPLSILKAAATYHLFTTSIGHQKGTIGPSMLPTLNTRGDVVWISTYHRRGRGVVAGDIVSLRHPLDPEVGVIKRVVGMGGEWVVVDDGSGSAGDGVSLGGGVDGDRLASGVEGTTEGGGPRYLCVPEGHCWVEGDHSAWSRDSRVYGPLPLGLVKGKVLGRIWPWRERRWFENPFQD